MRNNIWLAVLAVSLTTPNAQSSPSDSGAPPIQLTVARFAGSGDDSIGAMTSDAAGNIYIVGTTNSPDFPVKNAYQPAVGGVRFLHSTDRGLTWQPAPSPAPFPLTVTPHPVNPQILFLCAMDGVYKTSDGGRNWRRVFAQTSATSISIDPANPQRVYASYMLTSVPQVFASTDGGESWQQRQLPVGFTSYANAEASSEVWVDPTGSGTIGVLYDISRDCGLTWTSITRVPSGWLDWVVAAPGRSGWLYAASSNGTQGFLYVSTDWGTTWRQLSTPLWMDGSFQTTIDSLTFDPDVPGRFYANAHGFFVSDDGGSTWRTLSRDLGPAALLGRQCSGGAIVALAHGQVTASFDGGATWQPPQLANVRGVSHGAGCDLYATQSVPNDAFVAKLAPGGTEVLWSTFLGGSGTDSGSAVAVDPDGNVYVAGYTDSADFPAAPSFAGRQNAPAIFLGKLSPDGKLIWSTFFGGAGDTVTGVALNAAGEPHVVGYSLQSGLATTPGVFQPAPVADGYGFALKFEPDGGIIYATYFPDYPTYSVVYLQYFSPQPPKSFAATAERGGTLLVAGGSGRISRISTDGSNVTTVWSQNGEQIWSRGGQILDLQTGPEGDVYVAGYVAQGPLYSGACEAGYYFHQLLVLPPADILVAKLRAETLEPVFSRRLFGGCLSWPGSMRVDSAGQLALSLWTFGAFPTIDPELPSPRSCTAQGVAVVSRLAATTGPQPVSSYLDVCLPPPLALGPDGSIYAGLNRYDSGGTHAEVDHVLLPPIPYLRRPTRRPL